MSLSVGTLGFRPPQFSELLVEGIPELKAYGESFDGLAETFQLEDLAWLPGWLQQHQKEQLDEYTNKLKGTNSELASKDLRIFQGNTSEGKDANTFSLEEGRNNSCHLFLSGEDNSADSFASSPGNVLHFHLHLSSNGYSQCSPLQPLDASQNHLESTQVLSMQLSNTSVGSKLKSCSKIGLNVGGMNSLPPKSIEKHREDIVPPCPSNNKKSASHSGEKLDTRYLKAADLSDAVELSIAASEALVINEIMRSGLASDILPTAVVLETALQVKKARLEWLHDSLDSPAEETESCDSLSDLDDFTMADVYKDLGLCQSIPTDECACDSATSQVKETPFSGILYECGNLSDSSELRAQCVKFDDIPVPKELGENLVVDLKSRENFHPESVECENEQFHDKLVLGSNISVARYDPSAKNNSDGLTMKQTVGGMVDAALFQPQNNVNFRPHAWNSGNSKGEDTVSYFTSNRFRSRWLGGWTGQDVSATPELKQNTKSVRKCFAGETSFFSESADIAPDVNSFVKVHDTKFYRTSQSSIAFSGLHDEDNKGIMFSQDVVTSSSLSSVDPLCSVVPCSISSENGSLTSAHNQKDEENHNEERFRPTLELGVENSHKSSNPINKFPHKDGPSMPTINGERSPVTVRRQMISLRTYSTLLPDLVSIFDGGSFYRNQSFELKFDQRLSPLNKDVPCDRSSDKRSFKESLPSNTVSSYSAGRDNEGNGETTLDGNPVATLKNQKRSYHGTEGNGNELPVQASKKRRKRRQPLIFNHRSRFRIQASRPFMDNSTWEKHLKLDLLPENVVKLQQNEELENIESECKNFPDRDVLVKKRVHFCEADIAVQQNKNLQKLGSSTKDCSNARASKRWKHPKFQSHEKSSLSNCHLNSRKRLLFQGIDFLLTGFSSQKEKDIERQIWKHGGIVLSDIPSPNLRAKRSLRSNGYHLPVILCMKKLQTTKFLYGCAVNSLILKVDWLTNSISAGCILLPEKYMILPNRADAEHIIIGEPFNHNRNYVFEKVGIMLHGKHSFYSKLAKIIKHGGGKVFKTLQWLVHSLDKEKVTLGAIVAEVESRTSRHLRQCASEQKIAVMPASWIIKSLYLGKLLPFPDKGRPALPTIKISEIPVSAKVSEDV